MPHYVAIAGTEGWCDLGCTPAKWWMPGSPFAQFLRERGFLPLAPKRPFIWTTELDGASAWRRWVPGFDRRRDHRAWITGGANLYAFFDPPARPLACGVPYKDRNLIAHSHGLQNVLYACAEGLRVRRLISVGSPVRADLEDVAKAARPRIEKWLHISGGRKDFWQPLGEIGDGVLGIIRKHPLADRNDIVPEIGHSSILEKIECFSLWESKGWLKFIA